MERFPAPLLTPRDAGNWYTPEKVTCKDFFNLITHWPQGKMLGIDWLSRISPALAHPNSECRIVRFSFRRHFLLIPMQTQEFHKPSLAYFLIDVT